MIEVRERRRGKPVGAAHAGGLMFWANEVDAGLLVVSHLVALGAGAVAAARWTRRAFEGTRGALDDGLGRAADAARQRTPDQPPR